MAYDKMTGSIGPQLIQGSVTPVSPYSGVSASLPNMAAPVTFQNGTGLGNINLIGLASGTAAAAPASVDLTTMTDVVGAAINFARVRAVMILNKASNDAYKLLWDGTVTNAWKDPFNGLAVAKLSIPPGAIQAGTAVAPGGVLIWGSNLTGLVVAPTSKLIVLDPGANTIPYAVHLLGVNA